MHFSPVNHFNGFSEDSRHFWSIFYIITSRFFLPGVTEEGAEDSRVGLEVAVVDSLDQLLRDLYDLLFAGYTWDTETEP